MILLYLALYKVTMQKTSCIVHKPFSANQMYVPIARGKMIKSRKYNAWIDKNLPLMKEEMLPAYQFPINVELLVMANHLWRMKNDSDNLVKPLIDLLVRAEIIPDDTSRYIENVHIRYLYIPGDPMVRISYEPVE
jgi:Holliday junction resolvase RusA-like endonuclease